jgi:hypothetical protein
MQAGEPLPRRSQLAPRHRQLRTHALADEPRETRSHGQATAGLGQAVEACRLAEVRIFQRVVACPCFPGPVSFSRSKL